MGTSEGRLKLSGGRHMAVERSAGGVHLHAKLPPHGLISPVLDLGVVFSDLVAAYEGAKLQ